MRACTPSQMGYEVDGVRGEGAGRKAGDMKLYSEFIYQEAEGKKERNGREDTTPT
jgi:hypothetical protein